MAKEAGKAATKDRTSTKAAGTSKGKRQVPQPVWMEAPEEHDFPAAASYLSLLGSPHAVDATVAAPRQAPTVHFAAKDILRASRLPLLGPDNPHVAHDLAKVRDGRQLSPVLLVAGDLAGGRALQIADGYHRVCASYHLDENVQVSARIVTP